MNHTAWADINLTALTHNLATVRSLAPHSRVVAMIKADAYGHGLTAIAKALAGKADKLGVARFQEAVALRDCGINSPLLLMGTLLNHETLQWCANNNVAITLHEGNQLPLLLTSQLDHPLEVWLKADTGMNRLGLSADEFTQALSSLQKDSRFRLKALTHFSSADESSSPITQQQIKRFATLTSLAPDMERSLANSAGIIAWPESHADWVRPGIMLYGDNPTTAIETDLKAVMSLRARVIAIKDIRAGDSVGYGATWTATSPCRIAAIGIGYGDGYPRQVGNGCPVSIQGQLFPLVGRVSMDICSVDISQAASPINVGDVATMWGDELPAATIAARAGTISYHLFTGVTQRVPRIYS